MLIVSVPDRTINSLTYCLEFLLTMALRIWWNIKTSCLVGFPSNKLDFIIYGNERLNARACCLVRYYTLAACL